MYPAEGVQQQDGEGGQPAHDEDAQHDGDSFEEGVGRRVRGLLVAGAHNQVDFHIEDDDGEQYDAEDGDHEEDVLLGVERQHGRALGEVVDAVPANDGESPQQDRGHPAGPYQEEHAARLGGAVHLDLGDGEVALHGDGQQAEDRRCQGDESRALPDEPLDGRQIKGPRTRQEDVGDVGRARQQVREGQVADEEEHGRVELLVAAHGDEHEQVLQDDDGAEDHDDDVEGGELLLVLDARLHLLSAHVLCEGVVGLYKSLVVVLGVFALHGNWVAEHSGFTAKIHSHSGRVLPRHQSWSLPETTRGFQQGDGLSHSHVTGALQVTCRHRGREGGRVRLVVQRNFTYLSKHLERDDELAKLSVFLGKQGCRATARSSGRTVKTAAAMTRREAEQQRKAPNLPANECLSNTLQVIW